MKGTCLNLIEPTREQRLATYLSRKTHKPWYVCWKSDGSVVVLSDENLKRYCSNGFLILLGCVESKMADQCAEQLYRRTLLDWYVYRNANGNDMVISPDLVRCCCSLGCKLVQTSVFGWPSAFAPNLTIGYVS